MTICAFDGEILACDSQVTNGDNTLAYRATKITIVNRMAIASAGSVIMTELFDLWVKDGMDPAKYPTTPEADEDDDEEAFECFVLTLDNVLWFCNKSAGLGIKMIRRQAIGHTPAQHYALGLMDCGLNAIDAVKKACIHSVYCSEPIYSITREQLQKLPKDFCGPWMKKAKKTKSSSRSRAKGKPGSRKR